MMHRSSSERHQNEKTLLGITIEIAAVVRGEARVGQFFITRSQSSLIDILNVSPSSEAGVRSFLSVLCTLPFPNRSFFLAWWNDGRRHLFFPSPASALSLSFEIRRIIHHQYINPSLSSSMTKLPAKLQPTVGISLSLLALLYSTWAEGEGGESLKIILWQCHHLLQKWPLPLEFFRSSSSFFFFRPPTYHHHLFGSSKHVLLLPRKQPQVYLRNDNEAVQVQVVDH